MSYDGDSLLFGAKKVIRNWSVEERNAEADKLRKKRRLVKGKDVKESRFGDNDDSVSSTEDGVAFDGGANLRLTPRKRKGFSQGGIGARLGKDYVEVYSAEDIRGKFGVDRHGLILAEMLCGSHFEQPGAHGIGIKSAFQIAAGGYGSDVIDACLENDPTRLDDAKQALLEELKTNSRRLLNRRIASTATLPANWPNPNIVTQFTSPRLTVSNSPVMQVIRLQLESWMDNRTSPDIDGIVKFCKEHFEWGTRVVQKVEDLLGAALRVYNLRADAHKAALRGDVEEVCAQAEKDANKRKNVLITNLSSKKASVILGSVTPGGASSSAQNSKITDFFSIKKQPSLVGSPPVLSLKRKNSTFDAECRSPEVQSPRTSPILIPSDTPLIESITRRRVNTFGVEEVKVKWSKAAMEIVISGGEAKVPSLSRTSTPMSFGGYIDGGKTPLGKRQHAAVYEDEDESAGWEQRECDEEEKGRSASDLEWVEACFVRAAAPRVYAEYIVVEAYKKSRKEGTSIASIPGSGSLPVLKKQGSFSAIGTAKPFLARTPSGSSTSDFSTASKTALSKHLNRNTTPPSHPPFNNMPGGNTIKTPEQVTPIAGFDDFLKGGHGAQHMPTFGAVKNSPNNIFGDDAPILRGPRKNLFLGSGTPGKASLYDSAKDKDPFDSDSDEDHHVITIATTQPSKKRKSTTSTDLTTLDTSLPPALLRKRSSGNNTSSSSFMSSIEDPNDILNELPNLKRPPRAPRKMKALSIEEAAWKLEPDSPLSNRRVGNTSGGGNGIRRLLFADGVNERDVGAVKGLFGSSDGGDGDVFEMNRSVDGNGGSRMNERKRKGGMVGLRNDMEGKESM
jgi:hypothetical protein